eukprot:5111917-Pleurochrysis_carterae.AAC.3
MNGLQAGINERSLNSDTEPGQSCANSSSDPRAGSAEFLKRSRCESAARPATAAATASFSLLPTPRYAVYRVDSSERRNPGKMMTMAYASRRKGHTWTRNRVRYLTRCTRGGSRNRQPCCYAGEAKGAR